MNASNIALYIGGTRTRHGGFGYITSVGVLAGNEIEGDMDRSPASRASTDENPVITLKNADGYVYYKLWNSAIAPSDDVDKPGRLAICVTMPSDARLKNGKSPYDLLMEIYEKFLEIGTTKTEQGLTIFRDEDLDKADFVQIIERYPFESVPFKTEVMKGATIAEIQVPREKMEDFFRDAQYPEFVNYKAVEVTTRGRNMFPNLQIPRPASYEVFVNGQSTGKFLTDPNERFNAQQQGTDDIKYSSMSFSLAELLNGPDHERHNQNNTVTIKLNKTLRRIDCNLKPLPVTYKKQIKYTLDSDEAAQSYVKKGLSSGAVRIKLDDEDWNDVIKPSVAKDAIRRKAIDIYPRETEEYVLSINKVEIDSYNEAVILTIKAQEHRGKKAGNGGEEGEMSKRKFVIGLIAGSVAGLLLGIGGTLLVKHFQGGKAEKVETTELKTAEQKAYKEALALPHRTENVKKIEEQNEAYLSQLEKGDGSKYRNYLKEFAKDSQAYDEQNFNSIKKRLEEFKTDSLAYVNYRTEMDKLNKEKLEEANEALKKIQDANAKKDYKKVADMCEGYLRDYEKVSEENTNKVKEIQQAASDKLSQMAKEEEEQKRIETEALGFINNHDYKGYETWKKSNKLEGSKQLAIDWILDFERSVNGERTLKTLPPNIKLQVKNKIKEYLEGIGFKEGGGKNFKDWNEVMDVKKEIDKIVRNKGIDN